MDGDAGPPELRRCHVDELRGLFLFEALSDEQLGWLCREGRVESVEPSWVYREGERADDFYVLLEGSIVLTRRVGEDDVEVIRTDQRGAYARSDAGLFWRSGATGLPQLSASHGAVTVLRARSRQVRPPDA